MRAGTVVQRGVPQIGELTAHQLARRGDVEVLRERYAKIGSAFVTTGAHEESPLHKDLQRWLHDADSGDDLLSVGVAKTPPLGGCRKGRVSKLGRNLSRPGL